MLQKEQTSCGKNGEENARYKYKLESHFNMDGQRFVSLVFPLPSLENSAFKRLIKHQHGTGRRGRPQSPGGISSCSGLPCGQGSQCLSLRGSPDSWWAVPSRRTCTHRLPRPACCCLPPPLGGARSPAKVGPHQAQDGLWRLALVQVTAGSRHWLPRLRLRPGHRTV